MENNTKQKQFVGRDESRDWYPLHRNKSLPKFLRKYFFYYCLSAMDKYVWEEKGFVCPDLFATLNLTQEHLAEAEPHYSSRGFKNGDRVKVVMASTMGDLCVTKDFKRKFGYELRVYYDQLKDLSETP